MRAARQLHPNLPILAISGGGSFDPTDYLGMARVFGATDVMPKPFRPAELVDRVAKLLAA